MEVEVKVDGIPAIAKITHADYFPPTPKDHHNVSSPDDLGGWVIEYELLDRKGYPALWLEAKGIDVTDQIIEHLTK